MKTKLVTSFMVILILTINSLTVHSQKQQSIPVMKMSLQKIVPSDEDPGYFVRVNDIQAWNPKETAIIICDMWNKHWCQGATDRVAEMAPFMNNVVSIAREKGVLIVHAPSECIGYYKNDPARKLGQKYKSKKAISLISDNKLESEKDAVWPIDQSDGGCDCSPECKQGNPWTRQIDLIKISEKDAISDSGVEIAGLFNQKGIKNVILMGVHTNMCVIGRSFGLRNMVRLGMNVVLMRDLTDAMYDSKQKPNVSHFTGNSLINEYIETYVCPTIVSSDFTGQKQFRFKSDKRPIVAFIIAENEYHANQTLPAFAHELLLTKGVNCEFALGKPVYTGEGIHNIENLQILKDADLAVIQVRRRALPSEQMSLIKDYANSGKPILGLRTASHAFNANQVVPNTGGGVSAATGKVAEYLDQWPEFDKDVLGGNYVGHYGTMKVGIVFSVVPGMENHPLFKGVSPDDFVGAVAPLHTLYENRPLRSANIQVLLLGTVPEKPVEPVFWINHREKGTVIYSSLGHWEDWKIEKFRKIMFNTVDFLLNTNEK
jgi:nicotinamidase-related amidase/type 1 glutamine amidotransferase